MQNLQDNINQAIKDFDSIESAIKSKGISVPYGTDTSRYGDLIKSIPTNNGAIYKIECDEWTLDNTGLESKNTTKGIQDAINYAHDNGYLYCSFENGTYLIDCENQLTVKSVGGILIPNNMTLLLGNDVTFKIKPNALNSSYILFVIERCTNSGIIGGNLIGDRDTHDYTASGTHEFGHLVGIFISSYITLQNVNCKDPAGDCLCIGGKYHDGNTDYIRPNNIYINGCVFDGARRNNISIIDCDNGTIDGCIIKNAGTINGTLPKCGIDIEPNVIDPNIAYQKSYDIRIINNTFSSNENVAINCYHLNVSNVLISKNISDGTFLSQQNRDIRIIDNYFKNDSSEKKVTAIQVDYFNKDEDEEKQENRTIVSRNKLINMTMFINGSTVTVQNNMITDGCIESFFIKNSCISDNIIIRGYISTLFYNLTINNEDVTYSRNIIISNNLIYNSYIICGIRCFIQANNPANAIGIVINGNTIMDCEYGILVNVPKGDFVIRDNNIYSTVDYDSQNYKCNEYAIYVQGTTKTYIVNNSINKTAKIIYCCSNKNTDEFTITNNYGTAGNVTKSVYVIGSKDSDNEFINFDCLISNNCFKSLIGVSYFLQLANLNGCRVIGNDINCKSTGKAIDTSYSVNSLYVNNLIKNGSILSKHSSDTETGTIQYS